MFSENPKRTFTTNTSSFAKKNIRFDFNYELKIREA